MIITYLKIFHNTFQHLNISSYFLCIYISVKRLINLRIFIYLLKILIYYLIKMSRKTRSSTIKKIID